jgi:signal peptidase I
VNPIEETSIETAPNILADTPAPETIVAPRPRLSVSRILRELLDTLIITAILFLVINTATGRFMIESVSMLPNLREGEFILVDKVTYFFGAPQRGDIVVFHRSDEPKDLIKRVIGLPGDTIEAIDGVVHINQQALDEPYLEGVTTLNLNARVLGEDEYFVMGDNRNNSKDSRSFGPIHRADILGRAWVIYWPPADWGVVPHYTYAVGQTP